MSPEKGTSPKEYTLIMLKGEAAARKKVAAKTEGITFRCMTLAQAEREGFNPGGVPPDKVYGITTVENPEALSEFNEILKKEYRPFTGHSS